MFDTHCHLFDPPLDPGSALADAVRNKLTGLAVVCTHFSSLPKIIEGRPGVREVLPGAVFALGVHPWFVEELPEGWEEPLREALAHVEAVGEIGLDRGKRAPDIQLQLGPFSKQMAMARSLDKPALLHVVRAHDLVLAHLKEHPGGRGIIHAFSGSPADAKAYVALGWCLGIGGGIARESAHRLRRIVKGLPLEALVLETDSPYMWTPASEAGASAPADVVGVAEKLAEIKGVPLEQVVEITSANARRILT